MWLPATTVCGLTLGTTYCKSIFVSLACNTVVPALQGHATAGACKGCNRGLHSGCLLWLLTLNPVTLQDDLLIKAEGLENLTGDELRTACKTRGMKAAYGDGAIMYMRKQMQVSA